MARQAVSPAASGGAGTLFEYRVAAIMLTHLLAGTHPPGLLVPVVAVGLQQRVRGHLLDDVVVYGEPPPGSLCTEFQVKKTLTATANDEPFIDVVTEALHRLSADRQSVRPAGDLALGLIAERHANAMDQLAELARYARGHSSYRTFAEVFAEGVVGRRVRDRLRAVEAAVSVAVSRGAPDLGGPERTAHSLLAAMEVWQPSASDDGRDLLAALDRIRPLAGSFGVTPVTLFGHLAALAENWGPVAGVMDAEGVVRQLRRRGLREARSPGNAAAVTSGKIDTDAVVRGPVESLSLQGEVSEAERLLSSGDPKASRLFAEISARLGAAGFTPHAAIMRRRQADALQASGSPDEAAVTRIGLAWDALDAARTQDAAFTLLDGWRAGSQGPSGEAAQRAQAAASRAVDAAKDGNLTHFAAAFDKLATGDPYGSHAAAFFCEEAIAADRHDLLLDRRETLEEIAASEPVTDDTPARLRALRIQMCLADASGQWTTLFRDIHRRYPRPAVAWAQARYARHLAISGDGAGAQQHYLDAIERACAEEMFDEAADWLYAWRAVQIWYGELRKDEQHPLAQALRPYSRPSSLPGSPHAAEHALRAARDTAKPGAAVEEVLRWRWQAVVRGQLADELEAVETLGALLRDDDPDAAIRCLIRAGSGSAGEAAATLPEEPAHIDPVPLTAVAACRAAAYQAAAAAADLMTDEEACAWGDAALAEIASNQPFRPLGPSPELRAFDLLADVCDVLPSDQAGQLLRLAEPLIDRDPGHYRHTDEAVTRILLRLSASHPEVPDLLMRAAVADDRMAGLVLNRPDVLAAHQETAAHHLTPLAATSRLACLALIRAGVAPAPALSLAEAQVSKALAPRSHKSGVIDFYAGAPQTATLASVLSPETRARFARTMLDRTLDRREATPSRRDDLAGLATIAGYLDEDTPAELLPQVLAIASGQHDGGPADAALGITGTLADLALECAARLRPSEAQCAEIEQIAMARLRDADNPEQWAICHTLSLLPRAHSTLVNRHCAVHPLAPLRALAASRWAADPATLPQDIAKSLARDKEPRVRQTFARALAGREGDIRAEILRILAADPRRSVRRIANLPANRRP